MTVRRAEIERQNAHLLARQREFRAAADVVVAAWRSFAEVSAIALIGSVAKPLWKEVPRFQPFRHQGIELWHECKDLDLAVWIDGQERLGEMRRSRYLGRLCAFAQCPKGKRDCLTSGCGTIPFNKVVDGFQPQADLLAGAVPLYERASGRVWCAADLPATGESPPLP